MMWVWSSRVLYNLFQPGEQTRLTRLLGIDFIMAQPFLVMCPWRTKLGRKVLRSMTRKMARRGWLSVLALLLRSRECNSMTQRMSKVKPLKSCKRRWWLSMLWTRRLTGGISGFVQIDLSPIKSCLLSLVVCFVSQSSPEVIAWVVKACAYQRSTVFVTFSHMIFVSPNPCIKLCRFLEIMEELDAWFNHSQRSCGYPGSRYGFIYHDAPIMNIN